MEDLEEVEADTLSHMAQTLKQHKLHENRKMQHKLPELGRLNVLNNDIKQASYLNNASLITAIGGLSRCKETLIDAKVNNQEKVKNKHQELAH